MTTLSSVDSSSFMRSGKPFSSIQGCSKMSPHLRTAFQNAIDRVIITKSLPKRRSGRRSRDFSARFRKVQPSRAGKRSKSFRSRSKKIPPLSPEFKPKTTSSPKRTKECHSYKHGNCTQGIACHDVHPEIESLQRFVRKVDSICKKYLT